MSKLKFLKLIIGSANLFFAATVFAININCQLTSSSSNPLTLSPNQVGSVNYNCAGKGLGTLTKYKLSFSGASNLTISDVYSKSPHAVNISGSIPGTYTLSVNGLNWGAPAPPITFTSTSLTVIIQGGPAPTIPAVTGTLTCPGTVVVNTQTDCAVTLTNSNSVSVNATVSLSSSNPTQNFGAPQSCVGLTNTHPCNLTFLFTPTDLGSQTISVDYKGIPSTIPSINTEVMQVTAVPTPDITGTLNCPSSVLVNTPSKCSVSIVNGNNVPDSGTVSISSPSITFTPETTNTCTNVTLNSPCNLVFDFTAPSTAGFMTVNAGFPNIQIPSEIITITSAPPPSQKPTVQGTVTCTPNPATPGANVSCNVSFENQEIGSLLPNGGSLAISADANFTPASASYTCPNDSSTCTNLFDFTVIKSPQTPGTITATYTNNGVNNSPDVATDAITFTSTNNHITVSTPLQCGANNTVTANGSSITCQIGFTNNSGSAVNAGQITTQSTYNRIGSNTKASTPLVYSCPTPLDNNEVCSYSFEYYPSGTALIDPVTATFTDSEQDAATSSVNVTVNQKPNTLTINSFACTPNPANAGDVVTCDFTVQNNAAAALNNLTYAINPFALPANITACPSVAAGATCSGSFYFAAPVEQNSSVPISLIANANGTLLNELQIPFTLYNLTSQVDLACNPAEITVGQESTCSWNIENNQNSFLNGTINFFSNTAQAPILTSGCVTNAGANCNPSE